jgi:hypothetical protein
VDGPVSFSSFSWRSSSSCDLAGIGGASHLPGELFKMMAGVNLVHVPYRGNGPALVALLGGQVEALFPSLPSSIEYIRTGKLRGPAVTSAMRSEALPDLPTVRCGGAEAVRCGVAAGVVAARCGIAETVRYPAAVGIGIIAVCGSVICAASCLPVNPSADSCNARRAWRLSYSYLGLSAVKR